jgi:hypothetical protein
VRRKRKRHAAWHRDRVGNHRRSTALFVLHRRADASDGLGVGAGDLFDQGRDLLAKADGLAQYFDRDTSEDLANIAMKGFQEFMMYPDRLDSVLATIERARQRIYGSAPGATATK